MIPTTAPRPSQDNTHKIIRLTEPLPPEAVLRTAYGLDEAGRGPLAASVVAACVLLDPGKPIAGLNDSKKLSEKKRERLVPEIKTNAKAWAVASASVEEIDSMGILQSTFLAMRRALAQMPASTGLVLVDGNLIPPGMPENTIAIIKGDARVPAIMAASILAKVTRDAEMREAHVLYPYFGFDVHKGYGTAHHMAMLQKYGPCPLHRRSFAPVRAALALRKY